MKRFKLPRCPYCGKQTAFPEAWLQHTQGEYRCEKCGRDVDIVYDPVIYPMAGLTAALGVAIYLIQYFVIRADNWYGMIFVLLPFLFFYAAVPFTMHFTRLKGSAAGGGRPAGPAQEIRRPQSYGVPRASSPRTEDPAARRQNGTPRQSYPTQAVRTRPPEARPPHPAQRVGSPRQAQPGVPSQHRQPPPQAMRSTPPSAENRTARPPQRTSGARPAQTPQRPTSNPSAHNSSSAPIRRNTPNTGRDKELENILDDFFKN